MNVILNNFFTLKVYYEIIKFEKNIKKRKKHSLIKWLNSHYRKTKFFWIANLFVHARDRTKNFRNFKTIFDRITEFFLKIIILLNFNYKYSKLKMLFKMFQTNLYSFYYNLYNYLFICDNYLVIFTNRYNNNFK